MLNKRLEAIAAYLRQVGKDLARGDSTEHTHRRASQNLVEALVSGSTCTNEPKKTTDAGHPDMKVSQGETPLGFIETPGWYEFHIGGYQVLHKWLKDRKGRKLSNDDITHYQRVVVAIKETIRLMSEIDKAIPKWPIE